MVFSWQENWSALPFPPLRDLLTQRLNPHFLYLLHWQVDSLSEALNTHSILNNAINFCLTEMAWLYLQLHMDMRWSKEKDFLDALSWPCTYDKLHMRQDQRHSTSLLSLGESMWVVDGPLLHTGCWGAWGCAVSKMCLLTVQGPRKKCKWGSGFSE